MVFVESGGAREGAMEVPGGAPGVPKPSREASVNPADLPGGRGEVAQSYHTRGLGLPLSS